MAGSGETFVLRAVVSVEFQTLQITAEAQSSPAVPGQVFVGALPITLASSLLTMFRVLATGTILDIEAVEERVSPLTVADTLYYVVTATDEVENAVVADDVSRA